MYCIRGLWLKLPFNSPAPWPRLPRQAQGPTQSPDMIQFSTDEGHTHHPEKIQESCEARESHAAGSSGKAALSYSRR